MKDREIIRRPGSAILDRQHYRPTSSHGGTSQCHQRLRTYTACGILGAWSRACPDSDDSEGEEQALEGHERPGVGWASSDLAAYRNFRTSSTPSIERLIGEKVVTQVDLFEAMQKASGEKVLSRLRERQQSLAGEGGQHQNQGNSGPSSLEEWVPQNSCTRSLPRKLKPLQRPSQS